MKTCWPALLLLTLCTARASADRDIVYSARYYAPPASHRTSHEHIYRINPDGTGKMQLTFGAGDEESPKWSANGRQITFVAYRANSSAALLCRMNADGGSQRVLKPLGENETLPVPPTPGYRLENADPATDTGTATHTLVNLKTNKRLVLPVPPDDQWLGILLPMPGADLVYASNNHNSTVGTDYLFYRLNPAAGELRYLTEGQFLAWAPDGSRFCVAPGKDTTPYQKRKMPYSVQYYGQTVAQYQMVWSAPLYVRAARGGKMQQITPRLSYVDGADWRKAR